MRYVNPFLIEPAVRVRLPCYRTAHIRRITITSIMTGDPFGNGNEWPDSQVTKGENELVNNNT